MTNLVRSPSPGPPAPGDDTWLEYLRQVLSRYAEPLLRDVAAKLLRPRNYWTAEDLVEKMVATAANAPVIDRRLKELPTGCRRLLAVIALSGQPRWHIGNLLEILAALGDGDGLAAVLTLLHNGLLFPDLDMGSAAADPAAGSPSRCNSFEYWLSRAGGNALVVCSPPIITDRALHEDLGLPDLSSNEPGPTSSLDPHTSPREADGLEWLLRLAILWQLALASPFRRTQQGAFFKRDLDRLESDALLGSAPADALVDLPDTGQFTAALAVAAGLLVERQGELVAGDFPTVWAEGLSAALRALWAVLPQVQQWNAAHGGVPQEQVGNPYPSAYLMCLLLLLQPAVDRWAPAAAVSRWVVAHHPYWHPGVTMAGKAETDDHPALLSADVEEQGLEKFLLGVAHHMRLVQSARDGEGNWLVRLSPLGNWILGRGEKPLLPTFPQTLLVQPNLEILLYRQGATPELIAGLSRFARWKGLGAACCLQLLPETVYAGLERGETFDSILHTLQRHGIKPTPTPVIESLRTWSAKRDRITVYPSATVLEFLSAVDLADALARGIPAVQVGERLAVIRTDSDLDYQHFKLRGSRDYTLPPEPCIDVNDDGVTLQLDLNRSDLLLESEVRRFADEVDFQPQAGKRIFRLTPSSLARGEDCGLTIDALESWFLNRCGQPLSAAGRLLLASEQAPPSHVRRLTVLQVADESLAAGLMQWPETRELIAEQLGPTTLVVVEEVLPALQEKLSLLRMRLAFDDAPPAG
jgi:hypothetical protein